MTVVGTSPDDAGARSTATPSAGPNSASAGTSTSAGPNSASAGTQVRRKVSPELIAKVLSTDDLFPPTRAQRDARMPAPLRVASTAFTILGVALLGFLVYLLFVSRLHHDRAQLTAYANFRSNLALATAPLGQGRPDDPGRPLDVGTPVAVLDIGKLHLREVVFEGTDGSVLENGPGHLRFTPLPGQPGNSVIMGRSTLYGGPFGGISTLEPDDTFTITTGQGEHNYRVIGVRRAGDRLPPPIAANAGRVTLVTAGGNPFVASEVVWVDADLTSSAQARPAPILGIQEIAAAELPMQTDRTAWFPVLYFGAILLVVACLAAWTRYAWGGPQTWLVAMPVVVVLAIAIADQAVRLLPNLL
jgi:LPXTG-site transpeptidase (sortase) family protein